METTITVERETRDKLMDLKYKLKLENLNEVILKLIKKFEE